MEANESSEKIHPRRLKSFVRHVCILAKKHKDREDARQQLDEHVRRLKRFSKKKEMSDELKELDRKISLVLEKEKQLLGLGRYESAVSRELMNKVAENKAKIEQMNENVRDLRGRLHGYVKLKTHREREIKELEKRIKAKVKHKKGVSSLKNKLRNLEEIYNKLKKKGVDVSKVEGKIHELRVRLAA